VNGIGVGRRTLGVLIVIVGVAVAVTLVVRYFRGVDRDSYVAENERILSALPRPSGARETHRQVDEMEDCWGEQLCHTVGYSTYVVYQVPSRITDEDVIRLYRQRMSGWHRTSWTIDGDLFACFDRKRTIVAIATDGMGYSVNVSPNAGICD
jgi:hypothetical protein